MKDKFKWVSWVMPADTQDYRPVNFPPNEAILGWWCTGYSGCDAPVMVAMVKAETCEQAAEAVKKDWPEFQDWRFCEDAETLELSDRFPLSDWSQKRFDEAKKP